MRKHITGVTYRNDECTFEMYIDDEGEIIVKFTNIEMEHENRTVSIYNLFAFLDEIISREDSIKKYTG